MFFRRTVGLESGGYSVAKYGNVALTRIIPTFNSPPSDEGVKAFALCPWYVPTKMVTEEHKELNREDSKLRVAQEIHREPVFLE